MIEIALPVKRLLLIANLEFALATLWHEVA